MQTVLNADKTNSLLETVKTNSLLEIVKRTTLHQNLLFGNIEMHFAQIFEFSVSQIDFLDGYPPRFALQQLDFSTKCSVSSFRHRPNGEVTVHISKFAPCNQQKSNIFEISQFSVVGYFLLFEMLCSNFPRNRSSRKYAHVLLPCLHFGTPP